MKNSKWILPSDLVEAGVPSEDETYHDGLADPHHRRDQSQAEAQGERVCKFFLELNTTSAPPGFDLYNGIVFKLTSRNVAVEIKTLELDMQTMQSQQIKIFTKLGGYNASAGVLSDPDAWTAVTTDDAMAVVTADSRNAIVPVQQFTPIFMDPKETRLFYVALTTDLPLIKSSNNGTEFNQIYSENNELITHSGFGVTGSELFDATVVENQPFHGIVHYETKLPCEDEKDSFAVELPYFVNKLDPPVIVVSLVNEAINEAVSRAMSRNVNLVRMQSFEGLEFLDSQTETVIVPYTDPCPFGWEVCTKLLVTIHFGYEDGLQPGIVHFEVLKYATDYNSSNLQFELGYVGKAPLALDFFISLVGAPKTFDLDHTQQVYFGTQTAKFLSDISGEEILAAGLARTKQNQNVSASNVFDREGSRRLQTTEAKVHASIYGAYAAWPEPEYPNSTRGVDTYTTIETLQNAFDGNSTTYAQYLKDGLIRPGPMNENKRGDFFAGILNTSAQLDESSTWLPTEAPTMPPTMDPDVEPIVWGMPKSTLTILAIVMLVLGGLVFFYTIYWEYHDRKADKEKLKRNARAAQRKVDKLRAEQYRRIAEKKRKIQNATSNDDQESDNNDLTEPMI